jgi:hypothetical protein
MLRTLAVVFAVSLAGFSPGVCAEPDRTEACTQTFLVPVRYVAPLDSLQLFEVGLAGGLVFRVPRERFEYRTEKEAEEPTALVTAEVISSVPDELDRARNWTLRDFVFRRFRPKPGAARDRPTLTVVILVRDAIQQMDLESTFNPYWDKD